MLTIQADPIPIREEAGGVFRVGESRVLLELVIHAFEDGATPESIVERYSSLRLPDVYSVIAHYLNHRDEVAEHLRQRARKADKIISKVISDQRDVSEIRRRLLSTRAASESPDAPPRG